MALEADDLLKIVLVLVIVWLALEIVDMAFGLLAWILGPLKPLLGIVLIALIVLWLVDRL